MKLSKITAKAIFSVAFASIFLTFIISILFQFKSFENEIDKIKKDYIQLKKDEIQREVIKVFNTIDAQEKKLKIDIEKKLKERVDIGYNIAMSIYHENRDIKTKEEIQYLIVAALKNINFSENRAYYFINNNKGKAVLFNKQSKLNENINNWNLQDRTGKYFIREQSKIAKGAGEGFLQTHFVKPDLNDDFEYPKLSYVKLFEPYDWHIGMGEYIDDMTYNTKQKILTDISMVRFGIDGYIFVNSTNKKALVFDGKKLPKPKNYTNDFLYDKQINAIRNEKGSFFFYKFKKLRTIKEYPKLAFVKEYKKWGWIIGAGVYIDEIDADIIKKKEKYVEGIFDQVTTIFTALFVLLIIIYFISRKISGHVDTNITSLISSFKDASKNHKEMDTNELTYDEFKTLGKSLNKALKSRNETEKKLQDYIKIVNENVIISSTNKEGIITSANEAFCKISGYTKEELLGQSHNIIKHEDMSDEFYENLWLTIESGKSWEGEIKNKNKFGNSYWVKTIITPNKKDGEITGYTAVRQDITDKKKVEYLSITDELTGLKNRRCFNQTIKEEINRAKRDNHYLSFMMLDIDYFKKFNDTYGHQAGDEALKEFARVLRANTKRVSDFAFRLGGEEFALIFSSEDQDKSMDYANKIKNAIYELQIEHKTSKVDKYLTASIGLIVKKGKNINSSDELYKLADEALYEAKNSGRNKIVISS